MVIAGIFPVVYVSNLMNLFHKPISIYHGRVELSTVFFKYLSLFSLKLSSIVKEA